MFNCCSNRQYFMKIQFTVKISTFEPQPIFAKHDKNFIKTRIEDATMFHRLSSGNKQGMKLLSISISFNLISQNFTPTFKDTLPFRVIVK